MKSFSTYLIEREIALMEQEGQDQASELEAKVKEMSEPQAVERILQLFGAKDLDDLIQKLEKHPKVQSVMTQYKKLKSQVTAESSTLDEISWSGVLGGIWRALAGVVKWGMKSIIKTIGHVFAPFADRDASFFQKLNYAAALMLTFGLSGTLLASGVPMAAAVGGPVGGLTATWWGLMWFGKNILEPVLKWTDGVPSYA